MAMSPSMRRELKQLQPFAWLFGVCLLILWLLGRYPNLAAVFFRGLEYGAIVLMYLWGPFWLFMIFGWFARWLTEEPNTPAGISKERPDPPSP